MGIGQAAIFAKVRHILTSADGGLDMAAMYSLTLFQDIDELPMGFIKDGHALVWAGMLISQT